MGNPQELYGVRVGNVYFAGVSDAGFRTENTHPDNLTLRNVRVRTLKDPRVGFTEQGVFVWTEEHLRGLLNYVPNSDAIPSITLSRKGIDHLVAFLYDGEPALSK